MPKRKRRSKTELKTDERLRDAQRWLRRSSEPPDILGAYSARYQVSRAVAVDELHRLGYGEDVKIQRFEAEGIPWEFIVEPRSGEMYTVPEGTSEYEIHTAHGVF
jgi:hypothetical protein